MKHKSKLIDNTEKLFINILQAFLNDESAASISFRRFIKCVFQTFFTILYYIPICIIPLTI